MFFVTNMATETFVARVVCIQHLKFTDRQIEDIHEVGGSVETTFSPINSAEFNLRIHNEGSADDGTIYCVILKNCSKNDFYIVNIYLQIESDITCRKQHFWLFSNKEIALPDQEFNENNFFKEFKCVMEIRVPEGNKF